MMGVCSVNDQERSKRILFICVEVWNSASVHNGFNEDMKAVLVFIAHGVGEGGC